jgi:hypothetical protein
MPTLSPSRERRESLGAAVAAERGRRLPRDADEALQKLVAGIGIGSFRYAAANFADSLRLNRRARLLALRGVDGRRRRLPAHQRLPAARHQIPAALAAYSLERELAPQG